MSDNKDWDRHEICLGCSEGHLSNCPKHPAAPRIPTDDHCGYEECCGVNWIAANCDDCSSIGEPCEYHAGKWKETKAKLRTKVLEEAEKACRIQKGRIHVWDKSAQKIIERETDGSCEHCATTIALLKRKE